MTPGVLVIETTTALKTYSADVSFVAAYDGEHVGTEWLHIVRKALTLARFNVAHVVRVEWSKRPGEKRRRR